MGAGVTKERNQESPRIVLDVLLRGLAAHCSVKSSFAFGLFAFKMQNGELLKLATLVNRGAEISSSV